MIVFLLFFASIFLPLVYSFLKKANLALALVLANLLVFVLQVFSARFSPEWYWELISSLAFPQYKISPTWVYQVFTHAFLHGGIYHILGNMLILFFVGVAFEEREGFKRFGVVYFPAMVFAVLFDTLFNFGRLSYAIGASGAVSGVLGAMLIRHPKAEIPMFLGPVFLLRVKAWIAILFFFMVETLLSFFSLAGVGGDGVAHLAHVGGFLSGVFIAMFFSGRRLREAKKEESPDLDVLAGLVTNKEQKKALENLRKGEIPDVIDAWLHHFAEHTRCRGCGKPMKYRKPDFVCDCGNVLRVWK
ncbi:MAG: rhomboid family intramembrane serine protease [Thermoplasmata archaeon]|nr:rhomboid family intramembrane serine protease [Thermoplasmata archaeon]